jgi:quercetin dioxygenase-like cupin family protein
MKTLTSLLAGLAAITLSVNAQTHATVRAQTPSGSPPPGHPIAGYVADDMKWIDGPPSLPGARMVVLQGDPTKAGPYTIRLKFAAGYRIPLHSHDADENLTVISGLLHIGIAPNFDQTNSKEIGASSFATIPAKMKHTAWCDAETIVQVHGIGPWNMHEAYPSATVQVGR